MKRPVLCVTLTLLLASCGGDGSPPATGAEPVHLSVVLHYEESFTQTQDYFVQQRNDLLALARYLRVHGITLNLGPDWAFMAAIGSFETDAMRQETGGKNLLRYLHEDLGHEIDPHAHEHGWNYADIAFLIEQQGVAPSGVASGLVIDPPSDSVYDHFLAPIEASRSPGYFWQAEWLWGDATSGHVGDTPASGIWRPRDRDRFYEHDDRAPIPCIGKYTNDIAGVYTLIDAIASGDAEGGHMYTAAVFIGQNNVASMLAELKGEMSHMKEEEAAGRLRFVSLGSVAEIWTNDYAAQGFLYLP